MKKNGLSDVAGMAGVSIATVYRALNGGGYVSAEVRSRVLKAASQLGYVPRAASRKPRFGVVISQYEENLCNFYRDTMLAEISRQCSALDIGLEMVFPRNVTALEDNFIRVALVLQQQTPELRKKAPNVNFVSLNSALEGVPDISTDNRWCMETGINYLLRHGCRRIMLVIPDDHPSGLARKKLFREIMEHADVAGTSYDVLHLYACPAVREALKKAVFEEGTDALFIGGEDMAARINWELFQLGVRIPEDLSLLAFEAPGSSCYMTPAHTTVQQDFPRLVSTALDWAMKLSAGETIPADRRLLLPGFFNERESVGHVMKNF